jgi:hypothetical protein
VISFKQLLEKASAINWKMWLCVGLGLLALPALRIYYVQEMLAALIGFSLLFAAIYVTVFAIFLLVRGSEPVIAWARPRVGRVLHWSAETGTGVARGTIASPDWAKVVHVWAKAVPHQLRSQQLRLNANYRTVCSRFAGLRPWAFPKVRRVAHWSAETGTGVARGAIVNPAWAKAVPVWAKAVPHRLRGQQMRLNANYRVAYTRLARLGPWAIPRVRRVAHWSAETGRGVARGVMASPAWAKAVPVWAKSLPHGFRKRQLKLNENYKMVRLRLARLRARQVYNVSLQKGGAALTMGLRTHKRISSQVGNWLRQPVRYPDFIRLRPISRVRSLRSRAQARPRR